MNKRRTFLISLLLPLLSGWALAQQPPQPALTPEPVFKAALVDLTGRPATLAPFQGQPLIINFWARWCGPCHNEIPLFAAEYARMKKAGVQLVGIALDDKPDAVRDFATAYDMHYPVLLIKEQGPELLKQLNNPEAGLPYTLVIDRKGKLVLHKLGAMTAAELQWAIEAVSK